MSPRHALPAAALLAAGLLAAAPPARAGRPTETLPAETFLVDVAYLHSWLTNAYDDEGGRTQLLDKLYRYEPGGGLQGIIIPDASVTYQVLIAKLQYGILDNLTLGLGVPVVLRTTVEPRLSWVPGDYMWWLGRTYTEEDFWEWAQSMGQPRPGTWVGNRGVLADIILGLRYRLSDYLPALTDQGVGLALTVQGALPTGRPKDPEEIVASGTTSWELHAQGELGLHLALDYRPRELDERLTVGLDLFYEALFEHTYDAPTGRKNPLILDLAPYTGERYSLDPGDFLGFQLVLDVVAWRGPVLETWLSGQVADPDSLPPLVSLSVGYAFTWLFQSDWESESELWDWTQEKLWRPGYKNRLTAELVVSLLRVGAPLQLSLTYSNLSWIPGRNSRATDSLSVGLRGPFKLF
ncbi:MAG TPA: hypothetical protein PK668_17840 [Myxococcota bacterium]|nr:hypothetical protein [Myxococcota bacterium]HRY95824.1 hypothetical protein [Myxococcota bacterium]HSA24866.1 hypothetical protein [Myxococcota bacterium]